MLWLLACEDADPTSGLIRADYKEIAFRLRLRNETVTECIREIQEAGFIECIETVKIRNETVTPETETDNNCPHLEIIKVFNFIQKGNGKELKRNSGRTWRQRQIFPAS